MTGSVSKRAAETVNQSATAAVEAAPAAPVVTVPISTDDPNDREQADREPNDREPADREPANPKPPEPRQPMPRTLVAALVVGILVVSSVLALNLATGALDRINPFRNGVVQLRTIDRSGPVVLKAITDLGDFRAASGYYELVVDVEKDVRPVPSFLAGERVLFIAAGTVEVGVDLRSLGSGAIVIDEARTSATITLPAPTLSAPRLDVDRSYIYSQQRGLIDRLRDAVGSADDQKPLYALASRRLAEAASTSDELSTRGENNTRSMLEGLLRSLGFTAVTVNFAG